MADSSAPLQMKLAGANAGGSPLPDAVQQKMEGAFGHDFSRVRVHHGDHAASIGAQAYAQGEHIHFARGRYSPHSHEGQRLLGHELAHVVQQRAGRVAVPQGKGLPINEDRSLEAEADAMGGRAAAGRPAHAGVGRGGVSSATPALQRMPIQRAKSRYHTRLQEKQQEIQDLSQKIHKINILPAGTKRFRRPPAARGRSGFDKHLRLTGPLKARYGNTLRYKKGPTKGTRHVDFSPFVMSTPGGQRMETNFQYQGTRAKDFAYADKLFNLTPATRPGTWHHPPDVDGKGRGSIQLIPTDLHNAIKHWGGVEQYKKLALLNAKLPNFY